MKSLKWFPLSVLLALFVVACAPPPSAQVPAQQPAPPPPHSVLPSTLVRDVHLQLYLHPETDQEQFVRALEPFAIVENLPPEEQFYLAELQFLAFRPREAHDSFEPFTHGADWRAHVAWNRRAIMETRAFEDFDALQRTITAYRAAYAPSPEFFNAMGMGERGMCLHLGEAGRHAEAVTFVNETIERLPFDAPYGGFTTLWACFESFAQTNQQAEAIAAGERIRTGLAATLQARQANADAHPAYDPMQFENAEEAQWYARSTQAPYNFLTARLALMIADIDAFLACRRDGNCPAPSGD